MKTTLELPDGLMRRIKLRAVHRNRKLKDEIAQLLEAGIASAPEPEAPRRPPKPVRLRGRRPLKLNDIESAIAAGRE
jgi:plasmid stability protein